MKLSKEVKRVLDSVDGDTRNKIMGIIDDMDRELCRNGVSTHDLILCSEDEDGMGE